MDKKETIVYKATNKDMTCRGFKYELGKEYEIEGGIELCGNGFHGCKDPFDVFEFYSPISSRFFKAKMSGEIIHGDNKSVSKNIKLDVELNLSNFIKEGFKKVVDICLKSSKKSTSGDSSHANTSGYSSHANTSGYRSHANTSGYRSHANTSGDSSHANTSGDSSHANTSGDSSHANTSGYSSHANTSWDSSHANTSGDSSHANTSWDSSHANTSGDSSHANTSGYGSHANTSGDSSHANTSGYGSHANTSGDSSHANTSGYRSHANTSGYRSHANTSGDMSISCSIGIESRSIIKNKTSWLVVSNWVHEESGWVLKGVVSAKEGMVIYGIIIKLNHWYWFENGTFMEEAE